MDSSIIDQRRAGWMTHAPCARRSRVHVRAGFLRIAMAAAAALATLTLAPARAEAQVTSYAFVPNHNAGTMSVIDTRAAATTGAAVPVGSSPFGAVPTPDGRLVYVINQGGGTVSVLDAVTLTPVALPIPVGSNPYGIAVTPDGRKVYVTNQASNTISVITVATNTVTATIPIPLGPTGIAVSPDGQRAYVAKYFANSVAVIDVATDAVSGSPIAVGAAPVFVSFAPDGQRAYVSNSTSDSVSVIDVALGSVIATIPVGDSPYASVVAPDGLTLFVTSITTNNVSVVDLTSNTPGAPIPVGAAPRGMALTPDGQTAYVANLLSDTVSLIDVPSRTVSSTIAVGSSPWANGAFIGPNILTTACAGCGPLAIASDADLASLGFRAFVPFNSGVLLLNGNWTATRTLSMLLNGGTIDTQGFDAAVAGGVINNGALTKTGAGRLTLDGASTHAGGTTVTQGTLIINSSHTSPVHLQAGTLGGSGTIGTIDATAGTIDPGTNGPAILSAAQATLAAGVSFVAQINGPTAGTGYDRLDVSGTATLTQPTLTVQLGYAPAAGTVFTILTHANGTFAGLPENTLFTAGGSRLRITYHAGSGSDVALIADTPPTVTGLTNQTIFAGSALGPIAFTVNDDVTSPFALVVSATSSNASLLPDADIVLGGAGTARTLTATPVPGASGVTTITVTVSDGFQTTAQMFTLTVTPVPVYYLAEGATGGFFTTDLLLANPNASPAPAVLTFFKDDGTSIVRNITLPATSRLTMRVSHIAGLESAAFSTAVSSPSALPLVVERTMWWDASGYGAATEKASTGAASQWYFAEGAQGFFHTYYLLLNPHAIDTVAHVTYFPEDGPAVQRDYTVAATSRRTIDAGQEEVLANRAFGALVSFDLPGIAERAMYFGDTPFFSGGTAAAGVTAPATSWFLAEGATGTYFDTFVLIANPNDAAADVTLTYLPETGAPVAKTHALAGHARLTVNIATEDPTLASAAVATRVESTQPVIAERSQYWPHGGWYEAHNSPGETAAGTKWGLAEGRVGGTNAAQTYILIANPGTTAADITATFLRTDGTTLVKTFTVAPTSRFNIAVIGPGGNVPELADESFGAVIESTQPVIVERSMYTNAGGVVWAAGTNATATRLP